MVLRLATAVADMAAGGQVLLDPLSFKGVHSVLDQLHCSEWQCLLGLCQRCNRLVLLVADTAWFE